MAADLGRIFVDVDVQFDFCEPNGALVVPGSPNEVFRRLVAHAVAHEIPIVGSVDSHAWDAWEFASNDRVGDDAQKPGFPDHCVKGTAGWLKVSGTLPPRFRFVPNVEPRSLDAARALVDELAAGQTQGVYFEKEVYSLFANPIAEWFLRALGERARARGAPAEGPEYVVFGVATDYCVRAAALGLRQRGLRATLVRDAVAGITTEGAAAALGAMEEAGVGFTTSTQLFSEVHR